MRQEYDVYFEYKERKDSLTRKSLIKVPAKSWQKAKKLASESLKRRYFYIKVLNSNSTNAHVRDAEEDARVIMAVNEYLLQFNMGILILSIILYVIAGLLLLGGVIGLIYRGMVPAPEEQELLNIYNSLLAPIIIGLILGPIVGICSFLLFKFKGKKVIKK